MDIQFPGAWFSGPELDMISFSVLVDGNQYRCRVYGDALEDIDPQNRFDDKGDIFVRERDVFDGIARRKMLAGEVDGDVITIKSSDL